MFLYAPDWHRICSTMLIQQQRTILWGSVLIFCKYNSTVMAAGDTESSGSIHVHSSPELVSHNVLHLQPNQARRWPSSSLSSKQHTGEMQLVRDKKGSNARTTWTSLHRKQSRYRHPNTVHCTCVEYAEATTEQAAREWGRKVYSSFGDIQKYSRVK